MFAKCFAHFDEAILHDCQKLLFAQYGFDASHDSLLFFSHQHYNKQKL